MVALGSVLVTSLEINTVFTFGESERDPIYFPQLLPLKYYSYSSSSVISKLRNKNSHVNLRIDRFLIHFKGSRGNQSRCNQFSVRAYEIYTVLKIF